MTDGPLNIIRTINQLRMALHERRMSGEKIGLVPTMGALHDGHLSLVRVCKSECEITVVSVFVNPTQFGDPADLAAYPRDDAHDSALLANENVDVLFAPPVHEVYPPGFDTVINVGGVTAPLEGEARGVSHFQGVATIVAKFFNIVQPHVAYFGQKDFQQTCVIRKLTRDLDMSVDIVVRPTVREPDGLAMSSRNVRLSPAARVQAVALHEALSAIEHAAERGERHIRQLLALGHSRLESRGIRAEEVEYFSAVDSESLQPVADTRRATLFAIAARVGGVRLIDNTLVQPK